MNPIFWLLVLVMAGALWLALRKMFVWIGGKVWNVAEDTKNILAQKDEINSEHKGDNNNA